MKALMELQVSCNHAWVVSSPYLTPQWRATGSGCHAPIPISLMGSPRLGAQSWQEVSPLSPVTELDVTPGV